jgi:hypothetical protein
MLAKEYRVASNAVYGNTTYRKVHSAADFFSFLLHAAMMSACHYLMDVSVRQFRKPVNSMVSERLWIQFLTENNLKKVNRFT